MTLCSLCVLLALNASFSQNLADSVQNNAQPPTVSVDSVNILDSLTTLNNSLPDSLQSSLGRIIGDTFDMLISDEALENKIDYRARDSLIYQVQNGRIIMNGNADATYESVNVKADQIRFLWEESIIIANGVPDTFGIINTGAIFTEGENSFTSDSMRYGIKSKKGVVYTAVTQEGEGYLHSERVKQVEDNEFYSYRSKYTTCNLRKPHFHFGFKKAKVIPDKVIVTGPINLHVADIPTPLVLPFCLFPAQKGRRSGVVFPQYGQTTSLGFFLRDGGYFFGKSDKVTYKLTGSIYTKGDFGVKNEIRYNARYKFNGGIYLEYFRRLANNPELPQSDPSHEFKIEWRHNQDAKRHPTFRFSGNFSTQSRTYRTNTATVSDAALETKFISNISLTKTFRKTIFNSLVMNFSHSQDLKTGRLTIKFPEIVLNASTFYPFQFKKKPLKGKWWEKINMTYNFATKNQITTIDSTFFSSETLDKLNYGARHQFSVSAPVKVLKHFNLNTGFNYTERWYGRKIKKTWNPDTIITSTGMDAEGVESFDTTFGQLITDTMNQFSRVYNFGGSINLTTNLYGTYYFKSKRVKALRHVVTPSMGMSFSPNFHDERWGYYETVQNNANGSTTEYSFHDINRGIYGIPTSKLSARLNFSINNVFELKVANKDTSKADKKIKLLDFFRINSFYDFAKDSLQLGAFTFSGSSNMVPGVNFRFDFTLDPYTIDTLGRRVDVFRWTSNRRLTRLTNARLSFSASLNPKKKQQRQEAIQQNEFISERERDYVLYNLDQFYDFTIPWDLRVAYTFNLSKGKDGDFEANNITQNINMNGNFNLTQKWKVAASTRFDITNREFTQFNIGVVRDLHCWELRFDWSPFPNNISQFAIQLNAKSSLLQELKLAKRSGNIVNFSPSSLSGLGF